MTMKAFLKTQDFVDFFAFLSCVTPTNITGFTRSLDGFIDSDVALKTYQIEIELVTKDPELCDPEIWTEITIKAFFKLGILRICQCFLSRVTPTNIT